jgi:signal transduction histidine kinase
LALIAIAVFGAVVIALLAYVYWATASYVRSRSDRAIAAEQGMLLRAYQDGGRDALASTMTQRAAEQRLDGGVYLLADPSFAAVAGNLKTWPPHLQGSDGWGDFSADEHRALLRAHYQTLPDGYHLLVGKNIDDLGMFAENIGISLTLSLMLIFLLAAVASVTVTRRTVGRIETIGATSRAIMQSGLGTRIPTRGTHDEWDQVAENLNAMLDRIEVLMGEVKQATDNVAHDLRTPLARMRGRLEKAANQLREADSDQLLIADTVADLDSVLRIFSSLTRISQIEASDCKDAFRQVNLREIAREVVELFDAAVEETGGSLTVIGGDATITGDRDLLFDALANLIDNAIKHGRRGGRVTVEAASSDGAAVISVSDDGPGILRHEREHVFKRFYRLERSRHTPGNGLGLSLVAAVARLHGARIELLDNAPGLRLSISFPYNHPLS